MKNRWHNQFEFYETPSALTQFLFRTVWIQGRCFEPCAGSGAIVRDSGIIGPDWVSETLVKRVWTTNDIDPRWKTGTVLDATKPETWHDLCHQHEPDWTVSNTAFSIITDVAALALKHSKVGVALYCRLSIHEPLKTGPRRDFFEKHPPSQILFLPRFAYRRSPQTGKWTTDSMTACWVVWQKETTAQSIVYAPPYVMLALDIETEAYRARMDKLVGKRYRRPKAA